MSAATIAVGGRTPARQRFGRAWHGGEQRSPGCSRRVRWGNVGRLAALLAAAALIALGHGPPARRPRRRRPRSPGLRAAPPAPARCSSRRPGPRRAKPRAERAERRRTRRQPAPRRTRGAKRAARGGRRRWPREAAGTRHGAPSRSATGARRPASRASSRPSTAGRLRPASVPRTAPAVPASPRCPRSWSSTQSPGSRAVTIRLRPSARQERSSADIVSARWIASACSCTSNGFTDSANSASSSCAPVFSRQQRHAVALVDQRPLLGDQVHAVEHRVDHQQVVVLVGGDRLLEVLAQPQVDRHPVGGAVAVVDHGHQRLDPLQVLGVLGHVLARRDQVGDERDLLAGTRGAARGTGRRR